MRDLAGGVFGGVFAVLLGEDLRVLAVLHVEEEAVGDQASALDSEVAEGDHGCGGGFAGPLREFHLGGRAGCDLRGEALGDDVEDARAGEVGVERRVEGSLEWRRRLAKLGLKSATAMRMLVAPLEVSVLNQSCALAAETQRRTNVRVAKETREVRGVELRTVLEHTSLMVDANCEQERYRHRLPVIKRVRSRQN